MVVCCSKQESTILRMILLSLVLNTRLIAWRLQFDLFVLYVSTPQQMVSTNNCPSYVSISREKASNSHHNISMIHKSEKGTCHCMYVLSVNVFSSFIKKTKVNYYNCVDSQLILDEECE